MDQFVVQPFVSKGKNLQPTKMVAAKSAQAAIAEATRLGEQCGAAALHVEYDEDSGITSSIKVLVRVGNLPENFDETIGV